MTATPSATYTRRFLQRLLDERDLLAAELLGIADAARVPYADLLLSRLLVLMLVQRHGLLDGDRDYLRRRLDQLSSVQSSGPSFYRSFLLRLFREGVGVQRPYQAARALLGSVPGLGGNLFAEHDLERDYPWLDLPDATLARIFDCFDDLDWSLDEADHNQAVTPALIGTLCERGGDQKRLGAYYTASDVTGYITASTIIPWLLDTAAQTCPAVFGPAGSAWALLRRNPDRYIYGDLRHAVDLPLPANIAAGLDDISLREHWNRPALEPFGLAGETWREQVARRRRCLELRANLVGGGTHCADDLVSANLDLRLFAQDAITQCVEPAALLAVYHSLEALTVLDPTCGSGAFLFAALQVLEPLYLICLIHMQAFAAVPAVGEVLERAATYPNQHTFVRQSIIINNIYGVDIVPEAVDLCRLRLLLAVIATDPSAEASTLAELDVRIQQGNALIGFVGLPESQFVQGHDFSQVLDRRLATEDAVAVNDPAALDAWRQTQRPLHWSLAFPQALERGGFAVIVGNPPYVLAGEARRSRLIKNYRTAGCGNLYALVMERALGLLRPRGRLGMILPIASLATNGMRELQNLYRGLRQWHSHFAVRPAKLFDAVDMNLTITLLANSNEPGQVFSSSYRRWSVRRRGERASLFSTLAYAALPELHAHSCRFPKLGSAIETAILCRMIDHGRRLGSYAAQTGDTIYYHSGGRYWRKALPAKVSSHYKPLTLPPALAPLALALLNSQLFYWYWIAHSNCMDVVTREVLDLPVFALEVVDPQPFEAAVDRLLAAYQAGSTTRRRRGRQIQVDEINVDVQQAKPIIDQIDRLLAACYHFDDAQLDFILNYDIKYRCSTYESV